MEEAKEEKGMTASILIKSYPADFPWMPYCLRSMQFATGFKKPIIVIPTRTEPKLISCLAPAITLFEYTNRFVTIQAEEYGADGYLSQQVFKLYADTYANDDAGYILHIDSDTIFTRPVEPETYFTNGKIDWMMTPYSMIETPWQPITEKFLGQPVEFEFMRRPPQMIPRWLYAALREFCDQKHGCTLDQYIMKQPYRAFSEYNVLGAFACYYHHDKFNWINTAEVPESEWPLLTVLQKYSHGGLTAEIVAEFKEILAL